MSSNARKTDPRELAVSLSVADKHNDKDIAAQIGITDRQLRRWRKTAWYVARETELRAEIHAASTAIFIADRQNRLAALDDAFQRIQRVKAARGEALKDEAPGGDTGLLVRSTKIAANGTTVDEFAVDVALMRAERETLKQVAQELGEWTEKSEQIIDHDVTFTIEFDRQDQANGHVPETVALSETTGRHLLPGTVRADRGVN